MPRKLSKPLNAEDKAWLRSWNRDHEIPGDEAQSVETTDTVGTGDKSDEDPFHGEEPPDDYNDWNVAQLQHELGQRELPKSGNKGELVARLVEDDE